MLARLKTFTLLGIEAMPVDVEVDISPAAMPKTILVGLPDAAVKESTHRVERAIVNSGFTRPHDRVVINLAPGDLPKQAASFDLSVALGVLAGSGQMVADKFEQYAIIGRISARRPHAAGQRWSLHRDRIRQEQGPPRSGLARRKRGRSSRRGRTRSHPRGKPRAGGRLLRG